MRLSAACVALCGAAAVTAASLPKRLSTAGTQPGHPKGFWGSGFMTATSEDLASIPDSFDASLVITPEEVASGSTSVIDGTVANATTTSSCTSPTTRVEWNAMSATDKKAFVSAISCLTKAPSKGSYKGATNRFEDLAATHQILVNVIHEVGQFLPWHRWFVYIFESALRDECSYTGSFPWWDEELDAGDFSQSPLFSDDYFGQAPVLSANGSSTCVTTGAFAGLQLHIGPGSSDTPDGTCLDRGVTNSWTEASSSSSLDNCNSYSNFTSFASCIDLGPHGNGHNGIGGVMEDVAASPGDPIFYMHHTFIDHAWYTWQAAASKDRLYQIGGYTTQGGSTPVTLDFTLSSMGLKPDITVQELMDPQGGYLCYEYDY